MGVSIASDVFQGRMHKLYQVLLNVFVYIDDILVIGTGSFKNHIQEIREVARRLKESGMQINPAKSSWTEDEVEYLCFIINQEGVKSHRKNVQNVW